MNHLINKMLRRKTAVRINEAAMAAIQTAAQNAAPNETGGILLGWWEGSCVVVDSAAEVIDEHATSTSWTRRETATQIVLDAEIAKAGNPVLGYVGDWHCHPAIVGASPRDLESLVHSSSQYENPVLLIVHLSDGTIRTYAAHRGRHLKLERTT